LDSGVLEVGVIVKLGTRKQKQGRREMRREKVGEKVNAL